MPRRSISQPHTQSIDPEASGYVAPGTWVPQDDYDVPPKQPTKEVSYPQSNTVRIGGQVFKRVRRSTRFGSYETLELIDE